MKPFKITEIRVTAGKDVFLLGPESVTAVVGGRSFELPGKLSKELWKAVAPPAERMFNELRDWKPAV